MKKIPLTQGKFALVDDADYEELSKYKWYSWKGHGTFYAARKDSTSTQSYRPMILMHRVIMNTPKGMDTDHINGDGLNNQRSNLRVCTRSENLRNRGKQSNCTSGFNGVSFHKHAKKWVANIRTNGKQKHLGYFSTPEEAYAVYCEAAKKYHGEFANTG